MYGAVLNPYFTSVDSTSLVTAEIRICTVPSVSAMHTDIDVCTQGPTLRAVS